MVRATGGLRDTVFDVECDKARAAWEMEGSSDYERDDLDATNGFSFEASLSCMPTMAPKGWQWLTHPEWPVSNRDSATRVCLTGGHVGQT